MNLKSLLLPVALLFAVNAASAGTKDKKHKKEKEEVSFVEANVIEVYGDCGYVLQLSNGIILKPTTALPRKFRDNHLKVLVRYEDVEELKTGNSCNATKTVSVTEIKKYKITGHNRSKY